MVNNMADEIPKIDFLKIQSRWKHIPPYLYISSKGETELRIPYSDITVREMKYFKEATADADQMCVVIILR
jgi:hypothetical protein